MSIVSNTLIHGTILKDPGEGILIDLEAIGEGLGHATRILEDDATVRDIEDGSDRILEGD